jgi:IS30 family transposase
MKHITKEQRYQIEAYIKSDKSKQFIARELGVHPSTIYREVKRNAQKRGGYNAKVANILAEEKKERLCFPRKFDSSLEHRVRYFIKKEQWYPKQIHGHLKKNGEAYVSHERIYQYVRQDKENGGTLYKNMRHRLKHRKRPVGGKKVMIRNRVPIDQRPDAVNKKERFGDWEIDTIIGKDGKGAIVTIVERKTAFFMMRKLYKGKNAKALAKTIVEMMMPYKNHVLTITSDNGTEFAEHEFIASKLGTNFYFAHPYSSWERGLSEYTNKLIRQYIPKKSVFNNFSSDYITDIQHKINRRPRECLEFESPKAIFYKLVA